MTLENHIENKIIVTVDIDRPSFTNPNINSGRLEDVKYVVQKGFDVEGVPTPSTLDEAGKFVMKNGKQLGNHVMGIWWELSGKLAVCELEHHHFYDVNQRMKKLAIFNSKLLGCQRVMG